MAKAEYEDLKPGAATIFASLAGNNYIRVGRLDRQPSSIDRQS